MSHARSIAIVTQWRRLGGRIAQLIWLVFAALALGLALAGVRYRFTELQIVCDTPRCIVGQPTAEYVAFLAQMGESIDAVFLRDQAFSVIAYDSILSFLILALGGVLIWQKPGNAVSVLTAFVFVALAVMLLGTPDSLVRSYPAYALPVRFLRFLMLAGLFVVFSLLPNGRFFRSWLLWLAVFFVMAFFFFIILHGSTLDMPLSTENALLGMLSVLAVIVVGASLFSRLRAADNEITRQQLKWILIGTGIAIFWFGLQHILYFITPRGMRGYWLEYINLINLIVVMVFAGCITVAILQFQLFDIDIVINRGLVYGSLTLFIVVAYAVIVGGLSVAFAQLSFAEDAVVKFITPLIATTLIVLAFQPLHERVQRAVNRLMYGDRDEPYEVLTRLAQRLETAIEPLEALPLTVETIAHALKLTYVAIALKQDENLQTVAAIGVVQDQVGRFPLTYVGETIGELVVATRTGEQVFTPADHRLLSDLARQIGPVAHAALVSAELERARLRIVEAREEARRRLGSDLHDGVGHQLAGLARQSEQAISLLPQDPDAAQAQLNEIKTRIDHTIVQVRQLAHQLYPPELELLGLVGALRERVQANPAPGIMIRTDLSETLPILPTAIENAAYYIALEALTNVSKHAGARSCEIFLAWVDADEAHQSPSLNLEIWDDGRGLSPTDTLGLGLLSMQARAVEVGGVCTIEASQGGGTRVLVRLPCPLREE